MLAVQLKLLLSLYWPRKHQQKPQRKKRQQKKHQQKKRLQRKKCQQKQQPKRQQKKQQPKSSLLHNTRAAIIRVYWHRDNHGR
jgi:hypothetical protein